MCNNEKYVNSDDLNNIKILQFCTKIHNISDPSNLLKNKGNYFSNKPQKVTEIIVC